MIINADDWGRSQPETDAALDCYREGRVTSVSAMVFMQDSERAAGLARENGVDVGLHLNLSQRYDGGVSSASATKAQDRIVRFMTRSKYAVLLYQPCLRSQFREVYETQMEEFIRLYGKPPTHVDGHQHRHLCANMLVDEIIPRGLKVRRNFTFWPGEKGLVNRLYRSWVDHWLARKYRLTDFFFSLMQSLQAERMLQVAQMASQSSVELMTHPVNRPEYEWLMSDRHLETIRGVRTASYASL
jgi:chitin disaccharide deacetylase